MPNIVKVESEEELVQLTAELIHIMINLRFHQKYWHEHFGHQAKTNREKWELKADALLRRMNFTEHDNLKPVKIERQA